MPLGLALLVCGQITAGNMTTGQITDGQVKGGNVTGANITGANLNNAGIKGASITGTHVTTPSNQTTYPQFLHGIPFMAKEPGVQVQTEQSGEILTIPWEEVIHKHVRASDNEDILDVERVGNEFIVVRQGVAKVHLYYIPKSYINRYDGSSLHVTVPSRLISAKFERAPEEIRMLAEEDASRKET